MLVRIVVQCDMARRQYTSPVPTLAQLRSNSCWVTCDGRRRRQRNRRQRDTEPARGAPGSGAPRGNKNVLKHGLYTGEALA